MINKRHKREITASHARANNRTGHLNATKNSKRTNPEGISAIYVGSLQKPLIQMIYDDQEIMRANNTKLMRTLQSIGI